MVAGVGDSAVVVLVEERYRAQRQPAGLLAALERRGVPIVVADPELLVHDLGGSSWLDGTSLVVARGRSPSLLTALAVAESFGVPTVNRCAAVASVRDKAAMAAGLVSAGIPTPRTWVGSPALLAASIHPAAYPIVLKPIFGDNGAGVRLVERADDMPDHTEPSGALVAQRFVEGDGADVKVYAVGSRHWAVRVPSLFGGNGGSSPGDPEPVPLTPQLEALAEACGRLFGLDLFGVDCMIGPEGPVVVEVNDFPNYRGAAGSDDALADHVLAAADGPGAEVGPMRISR